MRPKLPRGARAFAPTTGQPPVECMSRVTSVETERMCAPIPGAAPESNAILARSKARASSGPMRGERPAASSSIRSAIAALLGDHAIDADVDIVAEHSPAQLHPRDLRLVDLVLALGLGEKPLAGFGLPAE